MANHVHQLERSHAKGPRLAAAGIKRGAIGTTLGQHTQGFGVIRARDPVDDKTGGGPGVHRGLAPGQRGVIQGAGHFRRSGQTRHHLHQRHQGCRIKEVQARQALRARERCTNGGDGNRRGVAGQNAALGHHGFQRLEQRLLDLQIFHNGFHHQGRIKQVHQLRDRLQASARSGGSLGADFALGRHFFKPGTNALNRLGGCAGAVVEQLDRVPAKCGHLGNTGAHGTGTDDGDHCVFGERLCHGVVSFR